MKIEIPEQKNVLAIIYDKQRYKTIVKIESESFLALGFKKLIETIAEELGIKKENLLEWLYKVILVAWKYEQEIRGEETCLLRQE